MTATHVIVAAIIALSMLMGWLATRIRSGRIRLIIGIACFPAAAGLMWFVRTHPDTPQLQSEGAAYAYLAIMSVLGLTALYLAFSSIRTAISRVIGP